MPDITGPPVTLDGTAIQGALITVINHDTGAVLGEATTDIAGNWAVTVDGGQTVHVLAEYEDANGALYQEHSKPFVVAETSVPTYIQNKGVLWIKMSEGSGTTAANSLSTYDATITGATWSSGTWVDGWALEFDGTDDYAQVADHPAINMGTGNFSVAATLSNRETTGTSADAIVMKYQVGGTTTATYGLLMTNPSTDTLMFRTRDSASVEAEPTATLANYPARVVGVRDGDTSHLYVNDTLASSVTLAVGSTDNTNALSIGQHATQDAFNGFIDDVLVCNQALTAAEVTEDYNRQPWSP